MSEDVPVLVKRRLQAEAIKPLYESMVEALGSEQANAILDQSIRKAAKTEARQFAERASNGTSMRSFIDLLELWTRGGALEIEVKHADDERFDFDVTRCRYAEMYREMGLAEIGHLLSCNRDGAFCEGYDPKLKLQREQTIMSGSPCCTFAIDTIPNRQRRALNQVEQ